MDLVSFLVGLLTGIVVGIAGLVILALSFKDRM